MKKVFAILLTFSLLFLFACNGEKEEAADTTTTLNTESTTEFVPVRLTLPTTEPTTAPAVFSEWGSDLLPEKFPAPPKGSHSLTITKGDHKKKENNYLSDWVRIEFTCPEHEFHSFTNAMLNLGYKGGSKRITEGTYYTNGYKGYWQDGKNIVKINSSTTLPDGTVTIVMDIIPCTDNFPEALEAYFPKFSGYTAGSGGYCGHDSSGASIASRYDGSFAKFWHWDFRFSNCFIGVSLDNYEAYCRALEKAGFSGTSSSAMVDSCNMITCNFKKTDGNTTYAVYLLLNQTLGTLEIAYTNDPGIYSGQQQH